MNGRLQVEANANDQRAITGHQLVNVADEVILCVGLGGVHRDPQIGLRFHEAVVGGLVKRLVLPTASVGDSACLKRKLSLGFTRLSSFPPSGTAGQC